MVLGLLQTDAYARAVLGALDQTDLDDRTAVRLARQRILEKGEPPVFWAVLSEAALHQEIGGPKTMREQTRPPVVVRGQSSGSTSRCCRSAWRTRWTARLVDVYRFASDPTIVYTESYGSGHPTASPDTVKDCSLRYDHLRASALSLRDSAELIRRAMEERYGEQRDSDGGPVA